MKKIYLFLQNSLLAFALVSFMLLLSNNTWGQTSVTYDTPGGPYTFTVPAGVTSIDVDAWGAGGGGAERSGFWFWWDAGGGAGGGGFSGGSLAVTPGDNISIYVGGGGTGATSDGQNGGNGGNSSATHSLGSIIANGGTGGQSNGSGGSGGGGSYTGAVSSYVSNNGGIGANRNNSNNDGGGGGGGAGTLNNGTAGSGTSGGAGGSANGGNGGNGSTGDPAGANGSSYGGGGGGASDNAASSGGNGANGAVILTYTVIIPPDNPATFSASTISSAQINLGFTTNGNGNNVIIAWNYTGTFTTPSGAPPAIGQVFAGGTLLYNGTSSPVNHTGLTSSTQYFYKAWSYDLSDYSTGVTDDATTLSDLWTGASSIVWGTGSNWEDGSVPTSSDNVRIPASINIGHYWPTISSLTLGTDCNDITMDGSSKLTVTSDLTIPLGYAFTCTGNASIFVEGDWTNNGSFIPGTGIVEFYGNTNSIIGGIGAKSGNNSVGLSVFQTDILIENSFDEIESDPNAKPRFVPPSDAVWDLQFSYDVDTPSGLTGISGSETDGTYLYGTKWSGTGEIVKFDLAGNYIETFTIPGVVNLRDLAYDGTYFYGSDAGAYIWEMDFVSKTLISTITTPATVRSIAYDSDLDGFWYNNFNTDLHFVNRSGALLNTITAPPSMYGCAYDNLSSGGPYLWIFTGTGAVPDVCQVEQYEISTKTLTGLSHSVSGDLGAYIAGGLWLQPNLVSGTYTLGGMAQGTPDLVFGYELGSLPLPRFYNLVDNKANAELVIDNDILVLNDITVKPGAYLTNSAGNTVDVTGDMLLEADDTGMASYIDNGTTTVGGVSSVEQYVVFDDIQGWQWHFVSSPTSDATINTYYDMFLYQYYENGNAPGGGYWENLWDPVTIPMNVGQGYNITGSNTWIGTTTVTYATNGGMLNNSDVTFTNFTMDDPDPNFVGFELVGNPFPCALQWNTNWSMPGLNGWMVILDDGIYRAYHTDGTPWQQGTSIIPSTQGFFVRATNLATASLTIPTSQRAHDSQDFYKGAEDFIYPIVRLEAIANSHTDESVVVFHPEGNTGFDDYYDLSKFTNAEGFPNLYSVSEGINYAFSFLSEEYIDMIVPMYFEMGIPGNCQIEATEINNISDEINVYLEDIKEGTVTNLSTDPVYEFDHNIDNEPHRFNLHFKESWYGVEDQTAGNINIYSAEDFVYIITPEMELGEVFIYDMLGQEILSQRINDTDLTKIRVSNGTAYYLVKFQSNEFLVTKKVFIR